MKGLAIALIAIIVFGAAPASAASHATARASAVLAIHSGPGERYPAIGKMAKNEIVRLDRCTWKSRWCYVIRDHGVEGWVLGSYLIGSPAKLEVTPSDFLFFHWPLRAR